MGGHAHGLSLTRLTNQQHSAVIKEISYRIQETFGLHPTPLPFAPNKETHGDVDLVLPLSNLDQQLTTADLEKIGLKNKKQQHSYLFSFSDKNESILVQVDINQLHIDNVERVLFMESYGDLGLIIGLLVKGFGCSLKSTGLFYTTSICNQKFEFLITKEVEEICKTYLGLDYHHWKVGFQNEEEMFRWLIPLEAELCNLTNINLKHYKDRAMFMHYLQWLQKETLHTDSDNSSRKMKMMDRMIESGVWTTISQKIVEEKQKMEKRQQFKTVFNATIINDFRQDLGYPTLEGPDLGIFMQKTKKILLELPNNIPTINQVQEAVKQSCQSL